MLKLKLLRKEQEEKTPVAEPEFRDLYDQKHALTGQTVKVGDPIPKGSYIQVVMVFIQNSEGLYLLQKRSKQRGGMFATTGGHPKAGQTSLEGMVAEIKEELGIAVNPKQLQLFYSGRSDEEQVFFDDYYLKADIPFSKLKLQKEEVQFVSWFLNYEVKALFKRNKLMTNHYEEYLRLQSWLKGSRAAKKYARKSIKLKG